MGVLPGRWSSQRVEEYCFLKMQRISPHHLLRQCPSLMLKAIFCLLSLFLFLLGSLVIPGKWDVQVREGAEWQVCTCDFFLRTGGSFGETYPLEIKTGRAAAWASPPQYYVDQVLWQLHVTGMDSAWLAVLILPEHEEDRIGVVYRDGTETMGPTTIRDEYFEVLRIAYQSNDPDERERGIPRLLKAWDDARVDGFLIARDEERIEEMVKRAEKFYEKLCEEM